ncbi:hypothetical protein SAMN04489841_0390 [Natrinema salaciae]|uniref:Uncharacterized protein n=1 Tax=Natrinema salaciae TaxID=1186196 RepID=A0A1H9A9P9_9EURY|nr:hypothetical protein SAMN04489841_0390 [Natrinema salaciae]
MEGSSLTIRYATGGGQHPDEPVERSPTGTRPTETCAVGSRRIGTDALPAETADEER